MIARRLKKLEATRNTGLEKTGRIVLSAGRLETQLGIISVASDGILKFVGVIKILEREPKPLPSQNLLALKYSSIGLRNALETKLYSKG